MIREECVVNTILENCRVLIVQIVTGNKPVLELDTSNTQYVERGY
jgi:hypothetical protein